MLPVNGLAACLVRDGLLDNSAALTAIDAAARASQPLTFYLVNSGLAASEAILACCLKYFDLPSFDLRNYDMAWLRDSPVSAEFLHRYHVLPLFRDERSLHLGVTDPACQAALSAIAFHTGLSIRPVLVDESRLTHILRSAAQANRLHWQLETTLAKIATVEEPRTEMDYEQNDEPIIEFVDRLIQDAVSRQASDIHIETYEQFSRIRFRHDGLLAEAAVIPRHLGNRVITRLKIMANLNIAERRLPQDGRIQLHFGRTTDLRVNVCPALSGEKIVLRIMHPDQFRLAIDELGMNSMQKQLFLQRLNQPQGLILVTGPTGSGKTVTLYTALQSLNCVEKNISTVEDPVEIELSGINQVSINPKIGLDFAAVLRSLLRQDPDVLMIGEVRDAETALTAAQAAQTGHLVLSTLHTNSAADTLVRLQSMGIAAHLVTASLSLIIAQRLVRKLCRRCRRQDMTDGQTQCVPQGCDDCHQGYQGRTGIFEVIPMTDLLSSLILSGASVRQLRDALHREGCLLLREAGLEKVRMGITSLAELARVTGES